MHYDTNIYSKEANILANGFRLLRSGIGKMRGAKPPAAPAAAARAVPPPPSPPPPGWSTPPPSTAARAAQAAAPAATAPASTTAATAPAAAATAPAAAAAASNAAPAAPGLGSKIMRGAFWAAPTIAMTAGPTIQAAQAVSGMRDAQSGFVEGAGTAAAQLLHALDNMTFAQKFGLLTMGSKAIDSPTGQKLIADYIGKSQNPHVKTMGPLILQRVQEQLQLGRAGKPMGMPGFMSQGGMVDQARAYIERALDEQRKAFQAMGDQSRMVGPPTPAPAA